MSRTMLCLTLILSCTAVVKADSYAYFEEVDNSAAAADPAWVEGTRTIDLIVVVEDDYPGDDLDWYLCESYVQIIGDTWYEHPFGSDYPPDPDLFELYPALEFDSYYCGADEDLSDGAPRPAFLRSTTTPHVKEATWSDWEDTGNGTYVIARFSIIPCPTGGSGHISGQCYLNPDMRSFYFGHLSPRPCIGDLDGSGTTDLSDLATMLASYGLDAGGDLNCDGQTDLSDLADLLANYGCEAW